MTTPLAAKEGPSAVSDEPPCGPCALILQIFRDNGATPADIAAIAESLRAIRPDNLPTYAEYLRGKSPAELAQVARQSRLDQQYVRGPDSLPQEGVPKGELFEFILDKSRIFPGTTRSIKVYVPAQYDATRPASVYVGLDGLLFEAPTVFDNLIHKGEMPVTIAIGVQPGTVPAANASGNARFNRSDEFDAMSDTLARFVLEEVLPEVERHKTSSGLPIVLSKNPNDRAAGGSSTGGIGSFTIAWTRPDAFHRVFSGIGTYVGMRGGDSYPVLVRKTEPKPIRIFLQDGSNDQLDALLGEVGNWWLSNQSMESALRFAGYQVEHVWGEGSHNPRHGTAIFPDAMRWLWKDWPQPVVSGMSNNVMLKSVLLPGETWQQVEGVQPSAAELTAGPDGVVQVTTDDGTWPIQQLRQGSGAAASKHREVIAFGSDGRRYTADTTRGTIIASGTDGKATTIATGIRVSHMVVTHAGQIYATEEGTKDAAGKIWLMAPSGAKRLLDKGINYPVGIAMSPDGQWLAVAEGRSRWGYSFRVLPDGTVDAKQRFYWFHVPDDAPDSGAEALAMDREGRLYAATRMGVQIFDRVGRSRAILPVPGGRVTGLTFGGADFDTLYVSCADGRIYRRKLKVSGAPAWAPPIDLPPGSPS